MHPRTLTDILSRHHLISDQITRPRLEVVLTQLETVFATDIDGAVTEFGCYAGTTSLFIRRLMDAYGQSSVRELHVYDSFEGLPAKNQQDSSPVGADFRAGELNVSKKQLLHEFQKARLAPPIVHKGWFKDLTARDVPEHIAFAFLDGDFYDSIIDSLRLVWPRLSPGGILTLDDYQRDALPGVERAVRDFFQDKPHTVQVAHGIGIIKKS